MKRPRRVQLITYVNPEIHERIITHAKRSKLSVSKVAERLLETGKFPDQSIELAVLQLLRVNADQARLGNLLLKGINEATDGQLVTDMQKLLADIRKTQSDIKARISGLKP